MSDTRYAEYVAIRRDLHQHPELGFKEQRTSDMVAMHLAALGYEVTRGLGGTGVVGQLRKGTGKKSIGLRADLDALPIDEQTNLSHASKTPHVMHACGHDGHTAMLLAAARDLAEDGNFNGTVNLIFQPAEEGLGGARKMIEDGLFQKFPCDAIFGMHNLPGAKAGELFFRSGSTMASSDSITVTLHGKGGHGALPQFTTDPVVGGAAVVMGLQTIVSRNVPPLEMAVITVGAFKAGAVANVIPDAAVLELSVRAMKKPVRELVIKRIEELVRSQAQAYGLRAEMAKRLGAPVLVNAERETAFARASATRLLGADTVKDFPEPLTVSEDFAFMLDEVPGNYVFIGNGDANGPSCHSTMLHNPGYDFNDAILPTGARYWVALAKDFLAP